MLFIIRFSTEDVRVSTPEKKSKPTTPTSTRPRSSADWLGLKANDDNTFLENDAKEVKTSAESPKAPSSPLLERKSSLTGSHATAAAKVAADTTAPTVNTTKQTKSEVAKSQIKEEEEDDDWLAGALSRKKALTVSNSEAQMSKQEDSLGLGEKVDLEPIVRYGGTHAQQKKHNDTYSDRRNLFLSAELLSIAVNKSLRRLPGTERTLLRLSRKQGKLFLV